MIFLDLLFNLTLLVALSIVSGFIEKRWPRQTRAGTLLQGLLFGGAAVVGMLRPLMLGPGLIFDGRSVMVSLGALYFGPVTAAVAAAMAILCRVELGGVGLLTGVLVILSSAGLGLLARLRVNPGLHPPSTSQLFLFGCAVHAAMLALMFTLPGGLGLQVVMRIGPTVLVLFPLATILVGKILSDQIAADQTLVRLRESETLFRRMFENHTAVMILIDPQTGRIVDANQAAAHYYGWPRDVLRTLRIQNINTLPAADVQREIERARSMEKVQFEFQHRRADGSLRDVRVFSSKIAVQGKDLLHAIVDDITERRQAKEALQQRTKELEARNAELERFNYTVSHDLKSPLVTIKAFLGFLEQDLSVRDTERIARDIDYIRSATLRMGHLLDELLEMSRVGWAVNPPEQVNFQELMREVLALMAGPLAEQTVEVEVADQDLRLFGDRPRLVEVWQNLTENAIKYMGDQPRPRIELGIDRQGPEPVFFVRDNGMGIESNCLEKVFGLFEKLDRQSEGSGLGLALVKRIVELHDGRIWAESAGIGQGSCFRFTLPQAIRQTERSL